MFPTYFNDTGILATGPDLPRPGPAARRRQGSAKIKSNSTAKGEDSSMKLKGKRNVTLELDTSPIQPHAEETSANHAPSHEEIRRRAYEIYLERDGLQGDALDDWLRAERELQKVALFKRGWNRLQDRVAPIPNVEIVVPNAEERKRSNQ
jgi:DUF2934 family protein